MREGGRRKTAGRSRDRLNLPFSNDPLLFDVWTDQISSSSPRFPSTSNMRLTSTLLLPFLSLLSCTSAQSPSASSTISLSSITRSGSFVAPTASASASYSQNSTSASSSLPPLASGSLIPNGTFIYPNGTSNATAANVTAPLPVPYLIKLDGAYGVAGSILILTGIPIATLGGKNRW